MVGRYSYKQLCSHRSGADWSVVAAINIGFLPEYVIPLGKFRKTVFRFYLAGGGNDGAIMFIRFFSGEIDEFSHVSAGLFSTAYKLLDDEVLPEYEYCALMEPMRWFDLHLKGPV